MAKVFDVAEVGEIKIFISNDGPAFTRLTLPIVERSGVEIDLQLAPTEYRKIWEMLAALRQQHPKAMGIQ